MNWSRFLNAVAAALAISAAACAGPTYVVTDRFVGQIHRLQDLNDDGDALDVGERVVWGQGLTNAAELARYQSGVLVMDSIAARTMYYQDRNGDGDALDTGEFSLWTSGFSNPFGIDVGPDGSAYISDFATQQVFRARDENHDGDALDAGERLLYAQGIPGAVSILAGGEEKFVVAFNSGQVHALKDKNGDGDALDTGENITHTPATITSIEGITDRPGGGYFVGSWFYDTIYSVRDRNGDGDALDTAEVVSYADNFFGNIKDPWGMTVGSNGELLVANSAGGNVLALVDKNHDGDALDIGEIVVFADGIGTPVDILMFSTGLAGDYNEDGTIDAADYTVWRDHLNSATSLPNDDSPGVGLDDYTRWKINFGQPGGSGGLTTTTASSDVAVPEPGTYMLLIVALAASGCYSRRFARRERLA